LELQLEDERDKGGRLRSLQAQAGDPDGLLARVEVLQDQLEQTRSALDAATQQSAPEPEQDTRVGQLEAQLEEARRELAEMQQQLALATTRLDGLLRQEGG